MPKKPNWDEVPCDACREPIAPAATRCPHCQTEFTPERVAQRKSEHQKTIYTGLGILFGLVLILIFIAQCTSSSDDSALSNGTQVAGNVVEAASPGSAKADAAAFYRRLVAAMEPCDAGGKKSADVAERVSKGQATVYDGYSASREQVEGCRQSADSFVSMEVPANFTGDARDAAEKAITTCRNAASIKQMAGETMMEIYDGESRPSKVAELQEQVSAAQGGILACVAQGMNAANKGGAELKDLQ